MIYASGNWLEAPDSTIILNAKQFQSSLFVAKNLLVLQATITITDEQNKSGLIMLEWTFKNIGMPFTKADSQQKESYLICGISTFDSFSCIPSIGGRSDALLHLTGNGINELSWLIRGNHSGMFSGLDYLSENVMIAYHPLNYLNIGIVLKKNLAMVYHPLKKNLMLVLPFLFLVMLIAAFILYRQVLPIVKAMLRAKNRANDMKHA